MLVRPWFLVSAVTFSIVFNFKYSIVKKWPNSKLVVSLKTPPNMTLEFKLLKCYFAPKKSVWNYGTWDENHRFEKENHLNQTCTHRIHGTSIFTYIYHKNQLNVGKYTSPMDPMGCVDVGLPILVFVGVEPKEVKAGHFILRGMWVNEDREQQMRTAWLFCIEQGKDVVICDVSSVLISTYCSSNIHVVY